MKKFRYYAYKKEKSVGWRIDNHVSAAKKIVHFQCIVSERVVIIEYPIDITLQVVCAE